MIVDMERSTHSVSYDIDIESELISDRKEGNVHTKQNEYRIERSHETK